MPTKVKTVYYVMIKIEEDLPWIELRGDYPTRREAKQAAKKAMNHIGVRIANVPQEKRATKTLLTIRARH